MMSLARSACSGVAPVRSLTKVAATTRPVRPTLR